jgi:hypothetical protein
MAVSVLSCRGKPLIAYRKLNHTQPGCTRCQRDVRLISL